MDKGISIVIGASVTVLAGTLVSIMLTFMYANVWVILSPLFASLAVVFAFLLFERFASGALKGLRGGSARMRREEAERLAQTTAARKEVDRTLKEVDALIAKYQDTLAKITQKIS